MNTTEKVERLNSLIHDILIDWLDQASDIKDNLTRKVLNDVSREVMYELFKTKDYHNIMYDLKFVTEQSLKDLIFQLKDNILNEKQVVFNIASEIVTTYTITEKDLFLVRQWCNYFNIVEYTVVEVLESYTGGLL